MARSLRELSPSTSRVLVLFNPDNSSNVSLLQNLETAGSASSMAIVKAPARTATDVSDAIQDFARQGVGFLAVLPDGRINTMRDVFLPLAIRHRMPAIYPFRFFAEEGGMMSYGIDAIEAVKQTATYVDRILRGENPADLPVQNPTKLELVINLKTAKAIGLNVTEAFLLRADQVIE